MFLLVSVRHVGAHPDELQHGVSIQSSINLGKTFPRISRIRIIPSTQILARVFVYLPPFISKILDFICRMVLILILIYFEWRDRSQIVRIRTYMGIYRKLKCNVKRPFTLGLCCFGTVFRLYTLFIFYVHFNPIDLTINYRGPAFSEGWNRS